MPQTTATLVTAYFVTQSYLHYVYLFIYLFIYLYQLYLHQKYINIYMQTVENGVPAGNNLRLIMPS